MLTSDFDYNLPHELIANLPMEKRDESRLMVLDGQGKKIEHKHFYDLPLFLRPGDLLVWNNSKVFRARLKGMVVLDEHSDGIEEPKGASGRIMNMPSVEIFLLRPTENFGVWRVLAKPAKKLRLGMKVVFAEGFEAEVLGKEIDGTVLAQFNEDDLSVRAKANKYGEVPLPPYIKNEELSDKELDRKYQTVYAKYEGSVAAPTAGFHFTPELIEKIKKVGVEFAEVTLHVGLGTFQPVKTEKIEDHKMHSEWVELTDDNADLINKAKREGRRVVAVGTTTVRVLEGLAKKFGDRTEKLKSYNGYINLFITPGFKFEITDALITNFHLPKSTLLMLVCAFAGDREFILDCYQKAVKAKYRFFSFGDAMFLG